VVVAKLPSICEAYKTKNQAIFGVPERKLQSRCIITAELMAIRTK